MNFNNSGEFLKKITVWIFAVAILGVLISLFTALSPLDKQIQQIKEDKHYYTNVNDNYGYYDFDDAIGEVSGQIAAAWLSAGISAFAAFVGCVVLYVLGDIADNVWIISRKPVSNKVKESAPPAAKPAKQNAEKEKTAVTEKTVEKAKEAPTSVKNANVTQVADTWVCKKCGASNKSCYGQCKKCGTNRTR